MRKSFFYLVFIGFLSFIKAQENSNINLSAKKWIEKTIYRIKNQKNTRIFFNYQVKNLPPLKKGEISLCKDTYRFLLENIIQICDGEKIYTINTKTKEITTTHKDLSGSLSLIAMLDIYKENFKFKKGIRKRYKQKNKIVQIIELFSKEGSGYKEKFLIEIDIFNFQIYKISMLSKNNTALEIFIEDWNENAKINPNLLKFDSLYLEKYENQGYLINQLD